MGVAQNEGMWRFWNNIRGFGAADGENLVPGAVDMDQGVGGQGVFPFQYGIDGPGYKVGVAGPDDFAHDLSVAA